MRDNPGQKLVTMSTGSVTSTISWADARMACDTGAPTTLLDMNKIGATGGLFAPMTTEQATMDAKWTGSMPFSTIAGRNNGAMTTVTERSSINAPATIRIRFTTKSAMIRLSIMLCMKSEMSCGMRSVARMREIMKENSKIKMIEPVVCAAMKKLWTSDFKLSDR